ncbi:hypothetical protein L5876_01380 [Hyphobacterium sp. SN044]|uniref:hypothetical protein n=1 Tax=Hyphobacterium sp. SN044 TaxID=2912575 RepID=UPI001F26C86F|nr:hypothetical protein [Hyphobacterium sp. SN044]MCF8878464.1 hypothetical protein [Hyphobacterium sp. SN044]
MIALFLALIASDPPAPACFQSRNEAEALLQLDEDAFDQGENGWRMIAERRDGACMVAAADLILDYIARHGEMLERTYLAHWHAGQMFALAGEDERALDQFRLSYRTGEETEMTAGMWNAYVDGTIAFMEGNRGALEAARSDLPSGPYTNRDVLDGFLNCFGEPYLVAYNPECRQARED